LSLASPVPGLPGRSWRSPPAPATGFPAGKTFPSWHGEESSIPEATQDALATLEWIGRAENHVIAGPSGTGKSHFAEALAHAAIENDLRAAWFTLKTLTATIAKAKGRRVHCPHRHPICHSGLIVVDDIGMLPAGQDAAEAFYRITGAACERRSAAVTSNIQPLVSGRGCCPAVSAQPRCR